MILMTFVYQNAIMSFSGMIISGPELFVTFESNKSRVSDLVLPCEKFNICFPVLLN